MSLTIKTNISSLIAQGSLTNSTNKLNQAIERMTTGYKINHSSDNAANYSISTNLTTKINAYQVAEDNVSMGLDLIQTASSALESMGDLTTRLRALATQAQNGTYGSQSIDALTKEANSIVAELNRLQTTAEYNGVKLLNSTSSSGGTAPEFITSVTKRDTSSMTALSTVNASTSLTSGTYSISTAEELAKLATMTNNGKIGANTEFVLANDIDLSAYSSGEGWTPIGNEEPTLSQATFLAKFDGNGYVISNLKIDRSDTTSFQALFGSVGNGSKLSNIGLKNVDVTACGGLVDCAYGSTITNCYVVGDIKGGDYTGGLVGQADKTTITNCYVAGSISSGVCVGGLVGYGNDVTIANSYSTAKVTGDTRVGGLAGDVCGGSITNCYANGAVSGNSEVGGLIGCVDDLEFSNVYFTNTTNQENGIGTGTPTSGTAMKVSTAELENLFKQGILPACQNISVDGDFGIIFQVGINSNESSRIGLTLEGIDLAQLDNIDLQSENIFDNLDNILATINERQTTFGSTQNRLLSALDEISTQYENLVSSRSTLRDADIAEVSSEYIKMQILQNASSTLLATANQTPALALQLL